MSPLLQLPRELRDMILSFVVTATIAAPTGPIQAEERSKRVGRYHPRGFAKCQKQWNRTKAIPTLLVNWQIHTETVQLIDRIKDVDYALDIMMVNQEELWPTWLSVPRLSTKINKVSASIRTFGSSKNVPNSTVQTYTGNHPALIWSFHLLLEDLLGYGPASFWNKKMKGNMVGVRTLELDFLTPDVPKELLSPSCLGTISLPQKRRNDGVDYIMHPRLLFNFVASNIAKLLDMRSGSMRYNSIIYERVGTIRLLLDGKQCSEWDIAQLLSISRLKYCKGLVGWLPKELILKSFNGWKEKNYHTRIRLGLPVLPFTEEVEDSPDAADA